MMTWAANGSGGGAGTIAGTMPRSSMFSFLGAGGKLFALEPSVHALPDPCDSDHKDAERTDAVPHPNVIHIYAVHAAISGCWSVAACIGAARHRLATERLAFGTGIAVLASWWADVRENSQRHERDFIPSRDPQIVNFHGSPNARLSSNNGNIAAARRATPKWVRCQEAPLHAGRRFGIGSGSELPTEWLP
jgi:hypothetical protein